MHADPSLSSDGRVAYSASNAGCGSAVSTTVSVAAGARAFGCTVVTVVATVELGSYTFVVNASRPVVYLDRIALSDVRFNASVPLDEAA